MSSSDRNSTYPAPYIVQPTGRWDGDDGNWTSFALEIGTPPQSFRVLPATQTSEIWIPVVEACQGPLAVLPDCGDLRGANAVNGAARRGFYRNESQSWNMVGIYELAAEQSLFRGQGLYGQDSVAVGRSPAGTAAATISKQTVTGISIIDFWLGGIGLGASTSNFSGSILPSLLGSMKNQSLIPSLSFGYTAGQHYNNAPGSLILGGFDQARLSANVVTSKINTATAPHRLEVNVQSIIASNTLTGSTRGLLPKTIVASVDTSTSQLWLPQQVCDNFVDAFGLTYDLNNQLYLVNDTIHERLRSNNATVTITLGGPSVGGTTNIVMYYNSFDLSIGIPLYSTNTTYFPIRRAANDSQITLGRAFMQEAYIAVDWERNNFTIGPVLPPSSKSNVIAVLPPQQTSESSPTASVQSSEPAPSSGLGIGAIAGIVVGMLMLLTAVGVAVYYWRRRRRYAAVRKSLESQAPEYHGAVQYYGGSEKPGDMKSPEMSGDETFHARKPSEIMSEHVYEMDAVAEEKELMSTPLNELPADHVGTEMGETDSKESLRRERIEAGIMTPVAAHPSDRIEQILSPASEASSSSPRPSSFASPPRPMSPEFEAITRMRNNVGSPERAKSPLSVSSVNDVD